MKAYFSIETQMKLKCKNVFFTCIAWFPTANVLSTNTANGVLQLTILIVNIRLHVMKIL